MEKNIAETSRDKLWTGKWGLTSLGLAICSRLVEMMEGKIGVESTHGKGSTFWFNITVPFVSQKPAPIQEQNKGTLKDYKILLVDNCPVVLDLFSEYLAITDITCHKASSTTEALEKLRDEKNKESPYDAILTDYTMPRMDGGTLCRKIKEAPEDYGTPRGIVISVFNKRNCLQDQMSSDVSVQLFEPIFPLPFIKNITKILTDKNYPKHTQQENSDSPTRSLGKLPTIDAHILIVEDDRISQRMMKSVLTELGCSFDLAGDGREALKILQKKHNDYDLVFMDWQMPTMDGHETIQNIREQSWGKDIRIIMFTANALAGDKDKCLKNGADDYIKKPIHVQEAIEILRKHLPDKAFKTH